jgi:hypothetical protein
MNRLPMFPGTTISVIRPQEASGTKTVQFANGVTQSWQTSNRDGLYRATYTNISDDQVRQVRNFFHANKSPGLWQCVSCEQVVLENCYFSERQFFPVVIKPAAGGNIVDLDFNARYQEQGCGSIQDPTVPKAE